MEGDILVTLDEVLHGATRTIQLERNKSMFDLLEELESLRAEVRFHRSH